MWMVEKLHKKDGIFWKYSMSSILFWFLTEQIDNLSFKMITALQRPNLYSCPKRWLLSDYIHMNLEGQSLEIVASQVTFFLP